LKCLVTGAAGFIGYFVTKKVYEQGHKVIGINNLNDYYDPKLKLARLEQIERVIHLAPQTGVRYTIENPMAYIDLNLVGIETILEGCRHNKAQHLVYASSSSLYGMNEKMPFSTEDAVDHLISLYAATKKSNELMAHSYSHL
jgi:UDP-glucuronate 4-epimerase